MFKMEGRRNGEGFTAEYHIHIPEGVLVSVVGRETMDSSCTEIRAFDGFYQNELISEGIDIVNPIKICAMCEPH